MVTLGLLFMGLWVTFSLFERGTRAFSLGDAQNDLSSDARRSLLALSSDIRLADADTLLVEDSPGRSAPDEAGVSVRRDGLCVATLSHWDNPDNFNLVQAGVYWDTYTVVYATRQPRGVLVRQTYQPPGAPYSAAMPDFTIGNCLNDDYKVNLNTRSTRILSQGVEEFRVEFDEDHKSLVLDLQLVERGSKKVGGRARNQRSHASLRLKLENTAPD